MSDNIANYVERTSCRIFVGDAQELLGFAAMAAEEFLRNLGQELNRSNGIEKIIDKVQKISGAEFEVVTQAKS